MHAATLEQGIASGVYKVTKLAPVPPRRHQLTMTRVAAGKSFALPTRASVRSSNRSTRGTAEQGKSFAKGKV